MVATNFLRDVRREGVTKWSVFEGISISRTVEVASRPRYVLVGTGRRAHVLVGRDIG